MRGENAINKNMIQAQKNKNDEFYTQYVDIEKEVKYYAKHFKDKIVYCNTDTTNSNFVKYFRDNFNNLQLKLLINSCIDGYIEVFNGRDISRKHIDGDFRRETSVGILKKCDIVVTNPPFSLFREYIFQLEKHDKCFLIIGNFNAVTYKEIFPLIKNNKMWLGHTTPKEFAQPDGSMKRFGNITWFTNLPSSKRQQSITLTKSYCDNIADYSKYDNYDAIEVPRVKDIPIDYRGIMGVPITFLNKYNPEQFEILGTQRWEKSKDLLDIYTGDAVPPEGDKKTTVNGKETYDRIFIRHI